MNVVKRSISRVMPGTKRSPSPTQRSPDSAVPAMQLLALASPQKVHATPSACEGACCRQTDPPLAPTKKPKKKKKSKPGGPYPKYDENTPVNVIMSELLTLRASNRQLKAAQEKHRSERKAETQKKRRMMGQDSDNIDARIVDDSMSEVQKKLLPGGGACFGWRASRRR